MSSARPEKAVVARTLGEVLRARRSRAGLTQEGLAERAGLSTKHIAHIERGERSPTVFVVLRLAAALDVSAAAMVAAVEDELSGTG